MKKDNCLNEEVIHKYLEDLFNDSEHQEVVEHLRYCQDCREKISIAEYVLASPTEEELAEVNKLLPVDPKEIFESAKEGYVRYKNILKKRVNIHHKTADSESLGSGSKQFERNYFDRTVDARPVRRMPLNRKIIMASSVMLLLLGVGITISSVERLSSSNQLVKNASEATELIDAYNHEQSDNPIRISDGTAETDGHLAKNMMQDRTTRDASSTVPLNTVLKVSQADSGSTKNSFSGFTADIMATPIEKDDDLDSVLLAASESIDSRGNPLDNTYSEDEGLNFGGAGSDDNYRAAIRLEWAPRAPRINITLTASNSNVGIGVTNPEAKLVVHGDSGTNLIEAYNDVSGLVFRVERATGNMFADGSFNFIGAELAEYIDVTNTVESGDVIEIDPDNPGKFRKAREAQSVRVAGIITTVPRVILDDNSVSGQKRNGRPAVALAGRVPVKAMAKFGAIEIGDLLVSSSIPGYAMKCSERSECMGAIIGKAMEPLAEGVAKIMVQVMLR